MVDIEKLTKEITSLIKKGNSQKSLPRGRFGGGCRLGGGCNLLIALSGGADSVALLRSMLQLGYKVEACHCNFLLRGEEANRDELFCKNLCKQLDVPLHIVHFDTRTYAAVHKMSIEMAARELRYNYFHQLIHDLSLDGVCVAHHKDDLVETVLLNLLRGTGLEGLKGIASQNGMVLRPLLGITRSEILDYLSSINQDYITDSSNLVADVKRNKIRLEVLPLLKLINPSVVENIYQTAQNVTDVLPFVAKAVEDATDRVQIKNEENEMVISIDSLKKEVSGETILWNLLKDKGFSSALVRQIFDNLDCQSGKEWSSASHQLVIDRGNIIIVPLSSDAPKEMVIPEPGTYIYKKGVKFRFDKKVIDESFEISRQSEKVCLDAAKVTFPLRIRTVRLGDWFIPFGMKGRKLVSDFLTDRKVSLIDKRQQLVITDANDTIIWLINQRPDARAAITSESIESLIITKETSPAILNS